MFSRVLLPTDGSDTSRGATEHAVSIARTYGATVHALYVRDESSVPTDIEGVPDNTDIPTELDEAATAAFEDVLESCEEASIPAQTTIETGEPSDSKTDIRSRTRHRPHRRRDTPAEGTGSVPPAEP